MRRLNRDEYASYGSAFDSWRRGDITRAEVPNFDFEKELACRYFVITDTNLYCLTPSNIRFKDFLVLKGAKVPVVLRKTSKENCEYTLVGPAYVHGFMDGEAMTLADEGRLQREEFVLA